MKARQMAFEAGAAGAASQAATGAGGAAMLASGAASVVISNSNQTTAGAPRITYRDANGPSRTVHVSAYTTGSFTLAGNSVGSDAVIEYEIV